MRLPRPALLATAAAAFVALHLLGNPAPAAASKTQIAIIEDDPHLLGDPSGTLATFRALGAQMVRVFVDWSQIAPDWHSSQQPAGFDATDPGDYPADAWDGWDAIVRDAHQDGLAVDFVLTGGAPHWAEGSRMPSEIRDNFNRAWYPSASKFEQFVNAVGTRYSGNYPDPQNPGSTLPRVSFWSIWNEPNFGEDLGPQATKGSTVPTAASMYRGLVNAGWQGLLASGHGRDTILIGELVARGTGPSRPTRSHPQGLPGNFSQTKPLQFLKTLYCVSSSYRQLRGGTARAVGCPTTSAGYRQFRSHNPGLFKATGLSDHPYPDGTPPNHDRGRDTDYSTMAKLPALEAEIDRLQRIYGSRTRFPIYNTEYGYITHPPNMGRYASPSTAAYYLNWAEYLSWRSSRIASTMQYLLYDPPPNPFLPQGGFDTGLRTDHGVDKPAFNAYRLPLYLPHTKARHGQSVEVWGCVRPAPFAALDTGGSQRVQIQLRGAGGSFTTVKTVNVTNPRGYFDTRVSFPASGTVRLVWSYPSGDSLLPTGTIYSRHATVTIR